MSDERCDLRKQICAPPKCQTMILVIRAFDNCQEKGWRFAEGGVCLCTILLLIAADFEDSRQRKRAD